MNVFDLRSLIAVAALLLVASLRPRRQDVTCRRSRVLWGAACFVTASVYVTWNRSLEVQVLAELRPDRGVTIGDVLVLFPLWWTWDLFRRADVGPA